MAQNVRNKIILADTILITKWLRQIADAPRGWFATFADAGRAGSFSFFNVRNRAIGLPYNNQDARDQLPYGMRLKSIGVSFFGPGCASQFTACEFIENVVAEPPAPSGPRYDSGADEPINPTAADLCNREELHSAWWQADIPNHASMILRTNQDERLKGPVVMFPPGYGPVGGGWGWGSPQSLAFDREAPASDFSPPCSDTITNRENVQSGVSDMRQRWEFPVSIDIPRRANLEVVIDLSDYAREALQVQEGPHWWPWINTLTAGVEDDPVATKSVKAAVFGIQVTLAGERLIQQRGEYHV